MSESGVAPTWVEGKNEMTGVALMPPAKCSSSYNSSGPALLRGRLRGREQSERADLGTKS